MAASIIVVHGGVWKNNLYEGGLQDYIPIPRIGINFQDLMKKVESRLMMDMSTSTFDLHASVKSAAGETMRMRITDEFEWTSLMEMIDLPTLYVTTRTKSKQCLPNLTNDEAVIIDELSVASIINTIPNSTLARTGAESQWFIPGASQQVAIDNYPTSFPMEDISTGQLARGSFFSSKDSMISSIHAYHLKNLFEFRTKVSDTKRYHAFCKFELLCVFSLRSKSFGCAWKIYELDGHTCERDLRTGPSAKVSSRSISEYVRPSMTEDGNVMRPRDIQGQLRRDLGIDLKYRNALAGRNRALKTIYGDEDKSFQLIAQYLYMLKHMNPGSVVDLQTCDNNLFQYCYFSLAASARAFRACRPVLVVDATHLKGKYKGVLFVVSTKDGNEQTVPLAFGVGDKENDSSWSWFFEHVKQSFGCRDNMLIVSDQHASIKNALELVYPGIPHGLCTFHIQGNIKSWGGEVIDFFQVAAGAYRESDFLMHMKNLEAHNSAAYAKLMDLDPIRWANSKCSVRRFEYGTSNAVEVLNARLKWARKLPVATLLEYARNLVQAWFYKRRNEATNRIHKLSVYAEKRLESAVVKGSYMRVEPISNTKYNIISRLNSYLVDLASKECTCKVFQLDLFPCSHAAAAIRYNKQTPVSYVHAYYSTATWRDIYAQEVMPVPDISEWCTPSEVQYRVVGTPKNPKQAGRPKGKRSEAGRVCSRCHLTGHYATWCTAFIPLSDEAEVGCSNSGEKRRRKPKTCSICGLVGHTRRRCQDPRRFE